MNIVCCQSIANNDNDGDRDSIYTSRSIDYILRLIESRCCKIEFHIIDDRSNITATIVYLFFVTPLHYLS